MSSTMRRFQDLHLPVVVVGPDGTVGYANPAAHRMLAYAPGALLGLPLEQLTAPDAWDDLCREPVLLDLFEEDASFVRDVGEGRVGRMQGQVVRSDGRVVDVAMTIEPASGHSQAFMISYEMLPPWKVKRAV
jgi:PAS domain S-box-containing protein